MKKSSITTLIILGILVIGAIVYFSLNHNPENSGNNSNEQTCTNQNGYCIYDVGEFAEYSSPSTEIESSLEIDPREYFEDYSSLTEISDLVCKDNGKNPEILNYFYSLGEEGMEGYDHERKEIQCGQSYLIYDFSSTYGSKYYGPFDYLDY